jgi:hypothetical protein
MVDLPVSDARDMLTFGITMKTRPEIRRRKIKKTLGEFKLSSLSLTGNIACFTGLGDQDS